MMQPAQWIERVMLGEVALGLCVIVVTVLGAVMLSGRFPVREAVRIVLGIFVVLGAPTIAGGLARSFVETAEMSLTQLAKVEGGNVRSDLPGAVYDPYAGASLGHE